MSKPILCFDFDGVIHSYKSKWTDAKTIPDPPVDGAITYLQTALKYFDVCIYSSRSGQEGGIDAMKKWLHHWVVTDPTTSTYSWLDEIQWPTSKPPAFLTIDDRVHCFDGRWPDLVALKAFKPWNKR